MSSSFSKDIANTKLMEIDREISITQSELIQCLSVASTNTEKILLVLAFLSSVEGKQALADPLQKIKEYLIMQDFKNANVLIEEILKNPNSFIKEQVVLEWSDALEHLRESFSREIVYSEQQENSPRRIFESILGQRYLASDNSLREIQLYYKSIDSAEQLSILISKTLMDEKGGEANLAWTYWKMLWDGIHQTIDRGRDGPKNTSDRPNIRTPGVLKSTTPRPMYMYDRDISFEGETSQSDKNRSKYNQQSPNWVQQNPESPFVASFSGHTIWFIGLLKAKCEQKPIAERQHFFDTMLKSYIAVYLSQGFHSLKEISDMIYDPFVLASLKEAGIEVNLEKLFVGPDGVLDKTFADSIDYNKIFLLRKSTQEELKKATIHIKSKLKIIEYNDEQIFQLIGDTLESLKIELTNFNIDTYLNEQDIEKEFSNSNDNYIVHQSSHKDFYCFSIKNSDNSIEKRYILKEDIKNNNPNIQVYLSPDKKEGQSLKELLKELASNENNDQIFQVIGETLQSLKIELTNFNIDTSLNEQDIEKEFSNGNDNYIVHQSNHKDFYCFSVKNSDDSIETRYILKEDIYNNNPNIQVYMSPDKKECQSLKELLKELASIENDLALEFRTSH
jgi:hypothetical protein